MNLNISPFYDDFDENKQYTKIIAVPGRTEQAREFTQIQSIMLNALKNLSATLLEEGSIVEGCTFSIDSNKLLTVSPGKIYLNGLVNIFKGGSIQLTGVSSEKVGVKIKETIITEADDSSLRDPAEGFVNYGIPGAYRLKTEIVLTLNDDSAPVIYEFYDGELQKEEQRPQLEIINQLLARRTYDESGNYKVSGLTIVASPYDSDNLMLTVDAGKAYVQGFEVNRPSPARITIPKALDTRGVSSEPKVYQSGNDVYRLNNSPVSEILKLTATVQITNTITRGSLSNGSDYLPNSPVVSIVSVSQNSTTFESGVDYQLSGDTIDWSLSGKEPATGTSYSITYQYNKTMVEGIDFELVNNPDGSNSIKFIGEDKPVPSTAFYIDYRYYLARIDRVYLDEDGVVSTVKGQSDRIELVKKPIDADLFRLSLGTVMLYPNSTKTSVENSAVTRVSMGDMQSVINRVNDLEYNQAVNDLDKEAMDGENATNLKGILTDGFLGFTKSDLGHPLYNASIDIARFLLGHSYQQTIIEPEVKGETTTAIKSFGDRFYTLAYEEEPVVSQLLASSTINVNPYKAYGKAPKLVTLPKEDAFVNVSNTTINSQTTQINRVAGWFSGNRDYIENLGSYTKIIETIHPYARQITISGSVTGFPYNTEVSGTIDGAVIQLVAKNGTTQLSDGKIQTNAIGDAEFTFIIPAGVRTGTREIVLTCGNETASSLFTSQGIDRTFETTVLTRRVITQTYDPLAQSFQLSSGRFITSLDLYFATKSLSDNVTVEIRNMVNGYPGNEVLGEATLKPADVNADVRGTKVTKVEFETPVFCEKNTQYCFVVATESNQYSLHYGKSGEKTTTGGVISGQPYVSGVMFSSSNALTWTAHQDSDIKFSLNGARFNTQGVLEFKYTSKLDIDTIALLTDFDLFNGATCTWEYQDKVDGNWLPLNPATENTLGSIATGIAIRAKLSTTSTEVSPIISGERLLLLAMKMNQESNYISRLVETAQDYTTVEQSFEALIPSGSSVVPMLSIDDETWVTGTLSDTQILGSSYVRYTYKYTIPESGVSRKFRARLKLTSESRFSKPLVRKFINIIK